MKGNANAVTGREKFIEGGAKAVGIPAPLTGLRATSMESDGKWTGCEATPMESCNHLDGSMILTVENTTESVERQTKQREEIIFPIKSRTRFIGKRMPLP